MCLGLDLAEEKRLLSPLYELCHAQGPGCMGNARHERGTKPSTVPHREVGHGRPSKWPLSSTKSRILAVLWWVAITYAVWVPHVCTDCCMSKIDNIAQVHNDGAGMSSIWVISFSVLLATIPPTWCHSFGILHVYLALVHTERSHSRTCQEFSFACTEQRECRLE